MKALTDSIVALVTPFKENLEIDYNAFVNLIKFHLQNGTSGIVVSGTTGESATLTSEEKLELLKITIDTVKKNNSSIPVVFNSGSNNTASSIVLSKEAEKLGADWLLLVAPYYNKPTQEGIYQHFKAIAQSVKLPISLYNVPGRTSSDISVETVIRLSKIENILAIKDATPFLNRPLEIALGAKDGFNQLSGEDATTLAYLASGGRGAISVTANIAPKACQEVHELWKSGKLEQALQNHLKLLPLHNAMFVESNPVPVKYALFLMGKCNYYVRQPLAELSNSNKLLIKQVLQNLKLI